MLDVEKVNGYWAVHAAASPGVKEITEAKPEEMEVVHVGQLQLTPTVTYKTGKLEVIPCNDSVCIEMKAEYLAPNHPKGSGQRYEQKNLLEHLPTWTAKSSG